jgi:hypothetical protein
MKRFQGKEHSRREPRREAARDIAATRVTKTIRPGDSGTAYIIGGANGFVCATCLGPVLAAIAVGCGKPRGIEDVSDAPTADKRCLLCDETITKGSLVAYRRPYYFCGDCLVKAFEVCCDAHDHTGKLAVVPF